jgi:hypothetical protein
MIQETRAYKAVCDTCGNSISVGTIPSRVALHAIMQGWKVAAGGGVTCDMCRMSPQKKRKVKP